MQRPLKNSLLLRLLLTYLVPTLLLFGLFGFFALRTTQKRLEQSLGRRLGGIAQAAATQIKPEAVSFLAPGDDASRTAKRLRHRLTTLQRRTRVARIFVIDKQLRSRCDSDPKTHIGDRYYQAEADRLELDAVFSGKDASSVLFVGVDGRYYKTSYTPLRNAENRVVAAIGVQGSAEYFEALKTLRAGLFVAGAVVAFLVILISVVVARRITRPLRALTEEATRIGAGDLTHPIAVKSGDEVGLLAKTMNEMRQDLHQREEQLQMMLSGIAHEVRNPLGGIALFAGLLRDELGQDPERLELVERIERELEYLKNVVGEFLDYARRIPPNLAPLELSSLLADAHQLLEGDAQKAKVALKLERDSAPAMGDPEQLRRVLLNLGRNAVQATSENGTVTLRSGVSSAQPFFEVEDTGCGINEELQAKIFEPFFTTREKGTGLGLALSKKIVQEHGGKIEVFSSDQGTRFRVTLVNPP